MKPHKPTRTALIRIFPLLTLLSLLTLSGCNQQNKPASNEPAEIHTTDTNKIPKTSVQTSSRKNHKSKNKSTASSLNQNSATHSNDGRSTIPRVKVIGNVSLPDNTPVADAAIKLWTTTDDTRTSIVWHVAAETKSGPDGKFNIDTPRKDYWALTARKGDYAIASKQENRYQASDDAPRSADHVNLVLQPGATLSGTVKDADGTPQPNANVLAASMVQSGVLVAELSTFTNATGRYTLKNIPEGAVSLGISASGKHFEIFNVTAPDAAADITLSDKQPSLAGHVVSDNIDLSKTSVTLRLDNGITMPGIRFREKREIAADGKFDFGVVTPGKFQLRTYASPIKAIPEILKYDTDGRYMPISLEDGKSTNVEVRLTAGKTIRGIVVEDETSQPLSGVLLYPDVYSMTNKINAVETTATGQFVVTPCPAVSSVQAVSDFYYWPKLPNDPSNESATEDEKPLTIRMKKSPVIRGSVKAAVGGAVAGAILTIYKDGKTEGESVPLLADGSFQAPAAPGKYYLVAQAPNYADVFSDKIELTLYDIDKVKLVLGQGRQASGVVLDSNGKPVKDAVVSAYLPPQGGSMSAIGYSTVWGARLGHQLANNPGNDRGEFVLSRLPLNSDIVLSAEAPGYAHPSYYMLSPSPESLADIEMTMPKSATLLGTIVDEENHPVSGAMVYINLFSESIYYSATAASSSTGTFILRNAPADTTTSLRIIKTGFEAYSEQVQINDNPVSVTLLREKTKTVLVKCLDAKTREPVDAELTVEDVFSKNAVEPIVLPVRDKIGEFTVSGLTIGKDCSFTGIAPDYAREATYTKISNEKNQVIDLPMKLNGKIKGRVVGSADHKPVENAAIKKTSGKELETKSDAYGNFELTAGGSNGKYMATALDGRISEVFSPIINPGDIVDVGDIEVSGKIPVTIRVIDGGTKKPVPNVELSIEAGTDSSASPKIVGKTDREGTFQTTVFPSQNLIIELPKFNISKAEAGGYHGSEEWVITCPIGMGTFSGRVLMDEKPVSSYISGSNKDAERLSVSAQSGSDGKFSFEGLMSGEWDFSASKSRNYARLKIQMPADGSDVEHDLIMDSGTISGLVVNEAGQPVPKAQVIFKSKASASGNTVTDESGKFEIQFPEGNYEIRATEESAGNSEIQNIYCPPTGKAAPVKLILKANPATITCTILSILDGMPAENAYATLKSGESLSSIGSSAPNAAGDVTIKNVPPGDSTLTVGAYGFEQIKKPITVESGQQLTFTEVLSPASSVNATVVDSDGYLVKNATVTLIPVDSDSRDTPKTEPTEDTGIAKFPSVLYGNYKLEALTPNGQNGAVTVSTNNQKNVTARIVIPAQK